MQDNILEMNAITKLFPGVKALDSINFSLRKGEIHALVGENGAGKSTLIKILGGVYSYDSGEILVEGKKVEYKSPREAADVGISIIHQDLNLVHYMSVAENLFMGRKPPKNAFGLVNWKELNKQSREMLAVVGLQDMVDKPVGQLSVAQQQLLQIGRGLSRGAKLVVFDEPTACLSRTEVENLFKVIRSLKEKGTSVIYVSHRMEEIFELADRVTVLRDGKMAGVYNIREVTVQQIINKMLGKEMVSDGGRASCVTEKVLLKASGLSSDTGVEDVSFELHEGEVLGLAGVVGSGRTEVARLLFGIDQLTRGSIEVDGQDLTKNSIGRAIKAGLALVPENRRSEGLVTSLNVKENITMVSLKDFSRGGLIQHKREAQVVKNLINSLSIRPGVPGRLTKYLSGGNQQKVVLAKWLAGKKPKVFIFDEPTQGIDVGSKAEVHQLIDDLAKNGAGIILISSDMQELLNLSDRILVMVRGKIVKSLRREEATANKILEYAMRKENNAQNE
ncbi:sugar ABC transporter ATP-binding protein [Zhaonella formicivorans]|uniref:sugar ABC transporter ATP-binding protein n=1 Tax=Zhaonella formicivorans TaxID=2528593 RepID=UPI0010CEA424|nr:sugar ABC transporter ATP-binding protein [Zhaonella formicivorans]